MDFLAVYNPTDEEITTRINGSFFSWGAGQIKQMRAGQAIFVDTHRKDTGLVKVEDPRFIPAEEAYIVNFDKTPEGQKVLAPLKELGIKNLIDHLLTVVRNNQICLRQDLANKYPTGDSGKMAAAQASQGEIEAMRMITKYKKKNKDNAAKQVDEIEKLMADIGPFTA